MDEVSIPPAVNDVNLVEEQDKPEEIPTAQDPPRAKPIPLPGNGGERRPYYVLTGGNAGALKAVLTREVPVLTQQLKQTMELVNQLN